MALNGLDLAPPHCPPGAFGNMGGGDGKEGVFLSPALGDGTGIYVLGAGTTNTLQHQEKSATAKNNKDCLVLKAKCVSVERHCC